MKYKLFLISVIAVMFFITLVSAAPLISFVSPTPANNANTSDSTAIFSANFSTSTFDTLLYNLNNFNSTIKDPSLVLCYNLDNNSNIGENSTYVVDWCAGNNGTVKSTNVTWTSNGKYNGAYNFSGNVNSYIDTNYNTDIGNTTGFTINVWAKNLYNLTSGSTNCAAVDGPDILVKGFNYRTYQRSDCRITWIIRNSTPTDRSITSSVSNNMSDHNWHYLSMVYDATHDRYLTYFDASLQGNLSVGGSIFNQTNHFTIGGGGSGGFYFTGLIDEPRIWNKTLTSDQILQQYNSQITKYNSTNYTVKVNESFGDNPETDTYQFIVNDSSGNSNQTEIRTINKLQTYEIVNIIGTTIGRIHDNFYGANTHNPGFFNANRDSAWLENLWSAISGNSSTTQRVDISLSGRYWGVTNGDLTQWVNTSVCWNTTQTSPQTAYLWTPQAFNNQTACASQSTDVPAGSGTNYSLNVTTTGAFGGSTTGYVAPLFMDNNAMFFNVGQTYNWSVWLRVDNGTAGFNTTRVVYFQDRDVFAAYGSSGTITLNNTWQRFTGGVNITYNAANGYRFTVDATTATKGLNYSILVNNLTITKNGVPIGISRRNVTGSGSDANFTGLLDWASNHNTKILMILENTPAFERNITSGCNNADSSCAPLNNSEWGDLAIDYLSRVDPNGSYNNTIAGFEITNEPQGSGWLDNYSTDNISKVAPYIALYNGTYNRIKQLAPWVSVGGAGGSDTLFDPNIINGFISYLNQSPGASNGRSDFIGMHPYHNLEAPYVLSQTQAVLALCSQYNASCPYIWLNEWNNNGVAMKNLTVNANNFSADIATSYINILNNYPANVTMDLYQWTEIFSYYHNQSSYPEYPQKWSMVSPPSLDNEILPSYTITQLFSNYMSSGDIIVNTSTSNTNLVSTANNNSQIVIVNNDPINTLAVKVTGLTSGNTLRDQNGNNYPIVNGNSIVGNLQPYQILALNSITTGPVTNLNDNGFAKTVLNIMVGFFSLAIVCGSIYLLKYFYDEGELTPVVMVTIFLLTLLGIIFVQIIATLVVAQ